jgi:hypothetical protein
MSKEKLKIQFAPGCFDNFTGTQEELNELLAHIEALCESGELLDNAELIDLDDSDIDDSNIDECSLTNIPTRH